VTAWRDWAINQRGDGGGAASRHIGFAAARRASTASLRAARLAALAPMRHCGRTPIVTSRKNGDVAYDVFQDGA